MNRRRFLRRAAVASAAVAGAGGLGYALFGDAGPRRRLLNASYDATREMYRDITRLFAAGHERRHGEGVRVRPSHGGSGSQARAVIEGMPADVVTLAIWHDTDALRREGVIDPGWETRLPNRSLPYTSTIVFVVRRGTTGVTDWADLVERPGLEVSTANPKTGGAAKLTFLAGWAAAKAAGANDAQAEDYLRALYRRVPVLKNSSRAASVAFVREGRGDVHLTWENEAHLVAREARGAVEVVYPPVSVRAEPHVAVADANARRNGTEQLAREYLEFLYAPAAQDVIAGHRFRPADPAAAARAGEAFPAVRAPGVGDILSGGWDEAQRRFFDEGALFDRLYQPS